MACIIGAEPFPTDYGNDDAFGELDYRMAIQRTLAAGSQQLTITKDWPALETSQGVYDWTDIDRVLAIGDGDVLVTVPVISFAGSINLPTYLTGQALDSSNVRTRLNALGTALNARTNSSRIKVIGLANEFDTYLSGHASDITPFGTLIDSFADHARGLSGWSALEVTASFKHTASASYTTTYAAIAAACTIASWTFYPVSGFVVHQDFRNPSTIATAIFNAWNTVLTDISRASILMEAGIPSDADQCLGSEELQGRFVQAAIVLANLFAAQDVAGRPAIGRMALLYESEWDDIVLDFFGYTGIARAFVKSLGLQTAGNIEKPGIRYFRDGMGGTSLKPHSYVDVAGTGAQSLSLAGAGSQSLSLAA